MKQNRTATIVAKEDTHLACMERSNYEKVLKFLEEKSLNDAVDFLQSLPLFSGWTKHSLAKFQYYFTKKSYIRNSVIYKLGDLATKIYIVRAGEFETTCRILSPYAKKYEVDYISHLDSPGKNHTPEAVYCNLLAQKIFLRPTPRKDVNVNAAVNRK